MANDDAFGAVGISLANGAPDVAIPSPSPHWVQYFAVGLFDAPHAEHCARSAAAHSPQYLAPSGLFEPQFAQRIAAPPSSIQAADQYLMAPQLSDSVRRALSLLR
jgi:hypothetical protein